MKIAFFVDEKLQLEAKRTKEWICGNNGLKIESFSTEKRFNLEKLKYAAFFNGKQYVFNIREILYLESYYRKTSVMVKEGQIRIKARLNEEEEKLPNQWFIRISRHNIVNMHHVKSVKGDEVEMINGEVLYISHNRRKKFGNGYRDFLRSNNILV